MLHSKRGGLSVVIRDTGECYFRYIYPLKKYHVSRIQELAIPNLTFDVHKNKARAVLELTGESSDCMRTFKAVQKTLMIATRQYKLVEIEEDLARLRYS